MEYELVREILNECPNNQMRDIFFEEVQTHDPEHYVRNFLKGTLEDIHTDPGKDGAVTVYATSGGITQKFVFTPI